MKFYQKKLPLLPLILVTTPLACKNQVQVDSDFQSLIAQNSIPATNSFKSTGGITEKCQILPQMPGGDYSKDDLEDEKEFCAINFYAPEIGLCPKTVSTSPGTYVFKIVKAGLSQSAFEASNCKNVGSIGSETAEKLGAFKQTMNAQATSGTFSTSSLLYYHFSRYIEATVKVPVSVYREMDKNAHLNRVTKLGQAQTSKGMIAAGWDVLAKAEVTPDSYSPTFELFTADKSKIYGILLRAGGERYGIEINGVRSGWGVADSEDFQRTPAYEALKRNEPIKSAIVNGKANYGTAVSALKQRDPESAKSLDALMVRVKSMPNEQMAFWMTEVSEIVLFDYIFSQQDRIGNIDYVWEWTYKENDPEKNKMVVKHKKIDRKFKDAPGSQYEALSKNPPAEIAALKPILLQRTILGDNDAGGRFQYANFAKRTKMLENLRHFNGKSYSKLLALNADLQKKGTIFQYLVKNFPLSEADQVKQIIDNTKLASDILRASCKAGSLKLDLSPKEFFIAGDVKPAFNCDGAAL